MAALTLLATLLLQVEDDLYRRLSISNVEILVDGRLAGCIGFRPWKHGDCEMKRLWVRPDYRGLGLGRRLATTCIGAAPAGGFKAICLDTLAFMAEARVLYASLGFKEIPAYYDNPLDDVRYMRLELAAGGTGMARA